MGLGSKFCTETVTYWSPGAPSGYGGVTFGSPVTILARWVDEVKLTEETATGRQFTSKHHAVVKATDGVIPGGMLAQGDLTASADPTLVDAWEIKGYESIPNLRATDRLERAMM